MHGFRGPHFDQNTHIPEEKALRDGCRALKKGAVLQFRFRENPSKKLKKTASKLNTHSVVHFQNIHVFQRFLTIFENAKVEKDKQTQTT